MYLNERLKDNIVESILLSLSEVRDLNNAPRDEVANIIRDAIDIAVEDTWEDMTLAERCGPGLWDFLHWMAAVADDENKPSLYYKALSVVQEGHPCREICRPHMKSNLQQVDPANFNSAVEHSVTLHNLVNAQLGKTEFSVEDAKKRLDLGCDSCTFNPVEKSRSQQHNAIDKTSTFSKGNEAYKNYSPFTRPSYNDAASKSHSRYHSDYQANTNYRSIGTGAKANNYNETSSFKRSSYPSQKRDKYSAIDTAIQYPTSFRIRDTSPTGIYTSRRSTAHY